MAQRPPILDGLTVQPSPVESLVSGHSHWGTYPAADQLPNTALNKAAEPAFTILQAGDTGYVAGQSTGYVCQSPGTVSGGDAVWRRQRRIVPCPWHLNGSLTLVTPGSGAISGGALADVSTATGLFDGFKEQPDNGSISSLIARQVVAGSAGTTGVEIYRYRVSVGMWVLVADVALPAAAGDGGSAAGIIVSPVIEAGDVLVAVILGIQAGLPEDLTVTCHIE